MTTVLDKTNQPPPVPAGSMVYVIIDPTGTPADRKATVEALAASPAFSDLYASFDDLPQPAPSTDVIWDFLTSPGYVLANLAPTIHPDVVQLNQTTQVGGVHLATITALPACTYSNGLGGSGATLTGNANGALADIDFVTPALGDWILVNNQADGTQHGIYELTTVGTAGTPFVLTRIEQANSAADFATGLFVYVANGITNRQTRWHATPLTVTMGTTTIKFEKDYRTPSVRRFVGTDFDGFLADIVVAGGADQPIPGGGGGFGASLVGGLTKITQVGAAEVVTTAGLNGVANLATGNTAAGAVGVAAGWKAGGPFVFDTTEWFDFCARWRIPTPSTAATQEFRCYFGALDAFAMTGVPPLRGLYLLAPEDGTSGTYDAVAQMTQAAETLIPWTRSGSTITITRAAHGLATGDSIYAALTSDAAAIPVASYYVTVLTANTFTVTGLAGGAASGTITLWRAPRTVVDTGIAVSALGNRRLRIRYNGTTGNAQFYVDAAGVMTLVATISTNIPSAVVLSVASSIVKQVGTTERNLYLDLIGALIPEDRAAMEMMVA